MYNYYVTFGWGHEHTIKGVFLNHDCVAVFKVNSKKEGEIKRERYFKTSYSWSYFDKEFDFKDVKYYPNGIKKIN